jgi:hypothetical protein
MQRPIGEFIPVHDIKISIKEVSRNIVARSLWHQRDLTINWKGEKAVVTLPIIDVYDVVVIDFK